ncbi:hypothetical protein AGLY_007717 [Aphis glycines]|uniref:Uncharacterized protein n=1 Tax=Aphis glycines TaxID=307491 RepID=A0A6G0TQ26_APHGL|nr:hypothetical protein AGLY_007717 [Aphis glycines]
MNYEVPIYSMKLTFVPLFTRTAQLYIDCLFCTHPFIQYISILLYPFPSMNPDNSNSTNYFKVEYLFRFEKGDKNKENMNSFNSTLSRLQVYEQALALIDLDSDELAPINKFKIGYNFLSLINYNYDRNDMTDELELFILEPETEDVDTTVLLLPFELITDVVLFSLRLSLKIAVKSAEPNCG